MGLSMDEIVFEVTFTSDKKPETLVYHLPLKSVLESAKDPLKTMIEIHTRLTQKAKRDAIDKFGDVVDKVINIGEPEQD